MTLADPVFAASFERQDARSEGQDGSTKAYRRLSALPETFMTVKCPYVLPEPTGRENHATALPEKWPLPGWQGRKLLDRAAGAEQQIKGGILLR